MTDRVTTMPVMAGTMLYLADCVNIGIGAGAASDPTVRRGDAMMALLFVYYMLLTGKKVTDETDADTMNTLLDDFKAFAEPLSRQALLLTVPIEGRVQ